MSNKSEDTIIPVNKEKTYGIGLSEDKLNVTVYQRKLYVVDTEVPTKFNKDVKYKFYAAGEYGPWQLSPRPYQANLERALSWIYDMCVMDKLGEAEDIKSLSDIVISERLSLMETIKTLPLKINGSSSDSRE